MSPERSISAPLEDWERVAEEIEAVIARQAITYGQWHDASGGVSQGLLRDLRRAGRLGYTPTILRKASIGLGWTGDSIELILRGKSPVVVSPKAEQDELLATVRGFGERLARVEAAVEELRGKEAPPLGLAAARHRSVEPEGSAGR